MNSILDEEAEPLTKAEMDQLLQSMYHGKDPEEIYKNRRELLDSWSKSNKVFEKIIHITFDEEDARTYIDYTKDPLFLISKNSILAKADDSFTTFEFSLDKNKTLCGCVSRTTFDEQKIKSYKEGDIVPLNTPLDANVDMLYRDHIVGNGEMLEYGKNNYGLRVLDDEQLEKNIINECNTFILIGTLNKTPHEVAGFGCGSYIEFTYKTKEVLPLVCNNKIVALGKVVDNSNTLGFEIVHLLNDLPLFND